MTYTYKSRKNTSETVQDIKCERKLFEFLIIIFKSTVAISSFYAADCNLVDLFVGSRLITTSLTGIWRSLFRLDVINILMVGGKSAIKSVFSMLHYSI